MLRSTIALSFVCVVCNTQEAAAFVQARNNPVAFLSQGRTALSGSRLSSGVGVGVDHAPGCGCPSCRVGHAESCSCVNCRAEHGVGCGCVSCRGEQHGAGCGCTNCRTEAHGVGCGCASCTINTHVPGCGCARCS